MSGEQVTEPKPAAEATGPAPTPWWRFSPVYFRGRARIVIAIFSLVSLAAALGAEHVWWLELPCHIQPQIAVVLWFALLVLLAASRRLRTFTRTDSLAVVAVLSMGGIALAQVFRLTPAQRMLVPPPLTDMDVELARLRVLTFNVQSSNRNFQAVLDLIDDEQPDVVLLMELNSRWLSALEPLAERYRYHLTHADDEGNFGIGVWSHWPIDDGFLTGFGSLTAQVHIIVRVPSTSGHGEQRIRFVGLHPLPPISSRYSSERNQVYVKAAEMLRNSPDRLPVIVAGDLNSTRFAPSFQEFCRVAQVYDAGYESNLGRSWPTGALHAFMGIRIDHVLIGAGWRVRRFRIGPDIGSDHYPLIADLQLAGAMP